MSQVKAMSNNLIFRASDTAAALERVQESLGPNAYIIEIKNVGNFVEITASLDEPVKQIREQPSKSTKPSIEAKQAFTPFDKGKNSFRSFQERESIEFGPGSQQEPNLEKVFLENADATNENIKSLPHKRQPEKAEKSVKTALDADFKPGNRSDYTDVSPKKNNLKNYSNGSEKLKSPYKKSFDLGFGDLLNLGLSRDFIKKQFSIEEFSGSITKVEFIQSLIDALSEPREKSIFEDYSNLAFLGIPGSGKSTICAKLMHFFGTQYSKKPTVVHVTPEKLFEADRLSFHAKMFNFPFKRYHVLENDKLFSGTAKLIELAWDCQIPFANFYSKNRNLYPNFKSFMVLPAEINIETLLQFFRVFPSIESVILNKCDYGRFSGKNLMMLYQNGCKISALSGHRTVTDALEVADQVMMRGFIEYTLKI